MSRIRIERLPVPYRALREVWWQILSYLPHAKIHEMKFYSRFFYHLASEFLDSQEYFPAQYKKIKIYDEHIFLLNQTGQLFHWSLLQGLDDNGGARNFAHIQALPCLIDFYVAERTFLSNRGGLYVVTQEGQVLRLDGSIEDCRTAPFVVVQNAPENVLSVVHVNGLDVYLTKDNHVYLSNGIDFGDLSIKTLFVGSMYSKEDIYLISTSGRLYVLHNWVELRLVSGVTNVDRMAKLGVENLVYTKEGDVFQVFIDHVAPTRGGKTYTHHVGADYQGQCRSYYLNLEGKVQARNWDFNTPRIEYLAHVIEYFRGRTCKELHKLSSRRLYMSYIVDITELRNGDFTLGLCPLSFRNKEPVSIPLPSQHALKLAQLRQEAPIMRPILTQAQFAQALLQCFKEGLDHYLRVSQKHVGRKLAGIWYRTSTTELHKCAAALHEAMSTSNAIFKHLSKVMALELLGPTHYLGAFKHILHEVVKKPYVLALLNLAKYGAAGKIQHALIFNDTARRYNFEAMPGPDYFESEDMYCVAYHRYLMKVIEFNLPKTESQLGIDVATTHCGRKVTQK